MGDNALGFSTCGVWKKHLLASAAGIALIASPAFAQQMVLEEITVTAQKREQDIQEVPIAVSAFTPEMLANKGISNVAQLGNLAPNVTLDASTPFSGSSFVLAAYIRGIGQNDFAFNFDPGVGIYVDGVYYARTVGANVDLLDVERVEILKGPQGTLFGRNTIGGAVNIITRTPGDVFAFQGEVTGGRFNRLDVRGAVDIPLTDSLSSSIAFSSKNQQGYQKRIPFPVDEPYANDPVDAFGQAGFETSDREGGTGEWNVRGKLHYDPNSDVTLTLSADYTNVDQPAVANTVLQPTDDVPGPFLGTNNIPGTALDPATNSGFLFAGAYNFCINHTPAEIAARGGQTACGVRGAPAEALPTDHPLNLPMITTSSIASVNVDGNPDNDRLPYDERFVLADPDLSYAGGNSFAELESYGMSATLDWDFSEFASLKSITAYRHLLWETGMDLDGSPLQILEPSFYTKQDQVSQELQVTGLAFDGKLDYVVGAYYFHEDGILIDYVTFPVGLLQVYGPNELNTDTWAVFAHLNYKLTDQFSITLGARYTEEDKKFEGFQHDLNGWNYKLFNLPINAATATALGFPDPDDPLRFFPPGQRTRNFTDFSPRVGIEFQPTEEILLYASYAEGFKSGGWTTRLSNPVTEDFSDQLAFDQEKATTYEIGVKTELLGRRLIWNTAGFYTDYKDIVLNFQIGISPTFRNAGDAEIYGFESELQAVLTESFRINTNVGYVHAEYTSIAAGAVGITVDNKLPKTPKWKISISPQYEAYLGNGGSILFNVDYTHTSALYNDTENTPLLKRPSTDELNASVTYKAPSGRWEAVVGATNITDERYIITGQAQVAGGVIYGTYNHPPEWYATVRFRY